MKSENYVIEKTGTLITFTYRNSTLYINISEIAYVEADDNESIVYLIDGTKYQSPRSLKQWEKVLHSEIFFRSHKSYLVNTVHVRGTLVNKKDILVIFRNDMKVPLAKRRKSDFIKFLHENFSVAV